ncbi:rho-associated protein kinase 2-like [Xiphophorus hellerii]|uniref:rho-associated protein kinase 2-like n=1 Tax=Xiphophorus hellerii TaxID=8084 RepID=UPI0013B3836F|nr:rho-associated protein kinase 2-like [Xiphophorus hellerii]
MEVRNYVNVPVNRGMDKARGSNKILQIVGVSFVLFCIIRSALNIYFWQQQVGLNKVFNVSECNASLLSENDIREHAVKENHVEEINQLKQDKAKLSKENNQLKQDKAKLSKENNQLRQEKISLVQEKNKQLENEQNFKNEKNQLFQEKKLLQDDNDKLNKILQQNEERMKRLMEENRKLQDQITDVLPHLPSTPECPPVSSPVCPPLTPPICPPVDPPLPQYVPQ